jgi:hypothetical protein
MLWKSCSSSYTEHNKIGFAIFGFFCDFIRFFKVAAKTHKGVKNHFASGPLERSGSSQQGPRFAQNSLDLLGALQCGPWGTGAARPAGFRRGRRRWPGKWGKGV